MKCKRFKNKELRHEEWFQFYTEFKALVEQYRPAVLNVEVLFITFVKLYTDADTALELIRKSAATEPIFDADNKRDCTLQGFFEAVKSSAHHFNAPKREAARRLQIVLDHYNGITRKLYDEETATIYNFLQEMNETHIGDIMLLGLEEWITQLDTDNKAFESLMKTRYDEAFSKTDLRMKIIREETDHCYRDMLDRIDAAVLLNGETPEFTAFIKELGLRVDRFSDILAQRKGLVAARKEKAKA